MDNIKQGVMNLIYYYECIEAPKFYSMFTVVRNTTWEVANTNHKLFFIIDGTCQIKINNKTYILEKDDIFYIPANTPYIRSPLKDEYCKILSVCFDISASRAEILSSDYNISANLDSYTLTEKLVEQSKFCFLLPSLTRDTSSDQTIKRQIDKIKSLFEINQPFNMQSTSFALCSLLTTISNMCYFTIAEKPETINSVEYPEPLKRAITYIKNHYSEQITLDDLCKASFISKQMLIRYFNKFLGKSPLVYITEYKMNLIKSLLLSSSEVSIKEICTLFGFEDQCYFSRIFKKYTGKTPRNYRNTFYDATQRTKQQPHKAKP